MPEPENVPVLRRKINAFKAQSQTDDGVLPKALRQAFARSAQDTLELEILMPGCVEGRVSVDELVGALQETQLLLLLKGPGDVHGLAVVGFQIVAAVIEHQTTGRVVPSEAEPRAATRTDAMMISDLLDSMFAVFDTELSKATDLPPAVGFRSMMVLNDQRAVSMALEEVPFRHFKLSLDLGRGAKTGEIDLYFPHDPPIQENFRTLEAADWKRKWQEHVMQLEAPIRAVIHRVSMSLEEVSSLEIGTVIPVPAAKINEVSIEGVDGKSVAVGKLGQISGNRAIRINTGYSEDANAGLPAAAVPAEIELAGGAVPNVPDNSGVGEADTALVGLSVEDVQAV